MPFITFWQIASVLSPINYTVTGLRVESRLSSSTRRTSKFAISNNQSRPKVLSFCLTRSIINCFMISISMGAVTIIWLPPQTPCEELFEELFYCRLPSAWTRWVAPQGPSRIQLHRRWLLSSSRVVTFERKTVAKFEYCSKYSHGLPDTVNDTFHMQRTNEKL